MRRHSHLRLLGVVLQLAPEDEDIERAARQWESLFGVKRVEAQNLAFTNASLTFSSGKEGEREGIQDIVVGVQGKEKLDGILGRASSEGLKVQHEDYGESFEMLGVKWRFLLGNENSRKSRL